MPAVLSRTTRMPNGLTNASPKQTLSNAGFPDPTWAMLLALDFINALDSSALSNSGGSTFALTTGVGGNALLTSGAVANTPAFASTPQNAFQIASGKRMFFKWKGSLDNLLGTIMVGFYAAAATGVAGVYITSDTSGNLFLNVNGTSNTQTAFPSSCKIAAGTVVELGLEIDPQGNVFAYWNPTTGGQPSSGTVGAVDGSTTVGTTPDGSVTALYTQLNGALTGVTPPTGTLLAGVGVNPTTAAARTLTSDFIVAAQDR